ncbi:MAG: cytochrome C [Sulfurovaceae bacterium]|nr:cytochrome C [Sulfurovaceae bacterium]
MIKQSIISITTIGLLTVSSFAEVNVKSCTGCHGNALEKKAMGVSKVLTAMKKADIVTALKGYKDGSYGGKLKAVMKSFSTKLSDAEINAIAQKFGK